MGFKIRGKYMSLDAKKSLPSRYCFKSNEDVCYGFLQVNEAETGAVEFEIGHFNDGFQKIIVECKDTLFTGKYYSKILE